jgi:hypothetical protein
MKGFNKPPSSKAVAGYRKTSDNSDTANMSRLSPSPKKLNATGKKGNMNGNVKQGSGQAMTNRTKSAAKKTMKQPSNY